MQGLAAAAARTLLSGSVSASAPLLQHAAAARTLLSGSLSASAPLLGGSMQHLVQQHACRSYAVAVNVTDGNVEAAWAQLKRKCAEADLPKEMRKRQHQLNPSERKFIKQTVAYNKAMGRIIHQRVQWLERKRLIKL